MQFIKLRWPKFCTAVIISQTWIRIYLAAMCVSLCCSIQVLFFSPEALQHKFQRKMLRVVLNLNQTSIWNAFSLTFPHPPHLPFLQLNLNCGVFEVFIDPEPEWVSGYLFSTKDWLKTSISSRVSFSWRLPELGSAGQRSIAIRSSPHSSVWHKPLLLRRNTLYCSRRGQEGTYSVWGHPIPS